MRPTSWRGGTLITSYELAEAAFDEFGDPEDPVWFTRFGDEQDNFRVAMSSLLDRGGDGALRLAQRLWVSWFGHGQLDEGERWVKLALRRPATVHLYRFAWMLGILGEFPRFRGDYDRSIPLKEEALALARPLATSRPMTAILCDLSSDLASLGDFDRARALVAEALEIERQSNDPSQIRALGAAAELAERAGDDEEARLLHEQIIERVREIGDTGNRYVGAMSFLAESVRRLGDSVGAAPLFAEALGAAEQAQIFTWVPESLDSIAGMIASRAPQRAAALLGAAAAARRKTGLAVFDMPEHEAITRAVHARLDRERFDGRVGRGQPQINHGGVS